MSDHAEEIARWLATARAGSPDAPGQALEACRGYLLMIAQQELDRNCAPRGAPPTWCRRPS
jgi:hypothetical protein